jgi:hypothetical protein
MSFLLSNVIPGTKGRVARVIAQLAAYALVIFCLVGGLYGHVYASDRIRNLQNLGTGISKSR